METLVAANIRPAAGADIAAIVPIEQCCFASPWTVDFFRHELYNPVSHFYVIEKEKVVVGYVIYWIIGRETHIANLAIHPDYRQLGYGKQLLIWAVEHARRKYAATVTLEVNAKNTNARQLYADFGFRVTGIRPHYYENRDDALIMTLKL